MCENNLQEGTSNTTTTHKVPPINEQLDMPGAASSRRDVRAQPLGHVSCLLVSHLVWGWLRPGMALLPDPEQKGGWSGWGVRRGLLKGLSSRRSRWPPHVMESECSRAVRRAHDYPPAPTRARATTRRGAAMKRARPTGGADGKCDLPEHGRSHEDPIAQAGAGTLAATGRPQCAHAVVCHSGQHQPPGAGWARAGLHNSADRVCNLHLTATRVAAPQSPIDGTAEAPTMSRALRRFLPPPPPFRAARRAPRAVSAARRARPRPRDPRPRSARSRGPAPPGRAP